MSESDTQRKVLKRYLTVNWKNESVGARKTKPDPANQSPHEFAIPVTVEIIVPEVELPELNATVEVPRPNVESDMRQEQAAHADPDAWMEVADATIDSILADGGSVDFDTVYGIVGRVMTNIDGYAKPERVKQYVNEELRSRSKKDQ